MKVSAYDNIAQEKQAREKTERMQGLRPVVAKRGPQDPDGLNTSSLAGHVDETCKLSFCHGVILATHPLAGLGGGQLGRR